ncbi:MAG: XdhC family protein [Alphaproteobacteria bacterium]
MKRELLGALLAARAAKTPIALATRLDTGAQALIGPMPVGGTWSRGDLTLDADSLAAVHLALAGDTSGMIETPSFRIFVQVYNPPLRLIVVGAVHIAQALVPMAALAGYSVVVVDPRRAFATDARFPHTTVTTEWPDDAMSRLAPDRRTAVVTLTHDPKLDDPALTVALKSDAFYIAALGSRKTHGARLKRLKDAGFDGAALARIHGPAGLAIGAKSPAEIALSIMAQATQILHAKTGAEG